MFFFIGIPGNYQLRSKAVLNMAPVYVKGGIWTNVEDEILKAAIAKYGLNQWSRVSSLLTRKNAKQCKLRWQEWLDPRISKLDWSPEEDRKLLNLAKLRPNQWSSISLLLNRTANQCIERYQDLLSDSTIDTTDSSNKNFLLTGNVENYGKTAGSTLGGLNLNPESKPARPDLLEMDDDELEMISEAKARLANTQGKKAKRKAREKILEESKRVAELLRRRELKQVGINADLKVKKKFKDQMNYNADIAFERRPEEGVFDTKQELYYNMKDKNNYTKNVKMGGTFNQEVQTQNRKEKRRREQNKKLVERYTNKENFDRDDLSDSEKYADEFSKRRKLTFIKTDEIEDIDKIVNEAAKEVSDTKTGKNTIFSRKEISKGVDENQNSDIPKKLVKDKEKLERKKIKEEKKQINKLLSNLPKPDDNYEIEVDEILNDNNSLESLNINISKQKVHVVVDKTEQRRMNYRKRIELESELEIMQTPTAIKRRLPIPVLINPGQESGIIENEMNRLIQLGTVMIKNVGLDELNATVELRNKIENQIEFEAKKLSDGKYEDLLKSNSGIYKSKNLLNFIKTSTDKCVDIENEINKFAISEKTHLNTNQLHKSLNSVKDSIKQTDNEIWAYEEFLKMESQSIEIRKNRFYKELDEINILIEEKKRELLST